MTEKVLTAEQTEEQQGVYAQGQIEALKFMRRHHFDFFPSKRNAETLNRAITKKGLEYTADNLDQTFTEIMAKTPELFDNTEDRRLKAKEPPPPPEPPKWEKVEIFPWGERLEGEAGKRRVVAMDKDLYREYLGSRKIVELPDGSKTTVGEIFQQQVNALNLRRGDLSMSSRH